MENSLLKTLGYQYVSEKRLQETLNGTEYLALLLLKFCMQTQMHAAPHIHMQSN